MPAFASQSTEQGTGIIIANQNSKLLVPRLLIGSSALTDGPSGVNRDPHPAGAKEYYYSTAFPTSTCLAATWDTEMVEKVGKALGNEALEYDYDLILMPALNLHRNPKCGRNFDLDPRSLASFRSGISSWVADKGDYQVRIGASSKDIRLKASFNVSKDIIVEKVHDVLYPNFAMKELSRKSK